MKRKLPWMKRGAKVAALEKPGTITGFDENVIDGTVYVYYIWVRLDGEKAPSPYHPSDIEEIQESEVANG